MVKTPRQRLSTEPPGAAPTGGRAGGAHSGLRVRGAGLCAPASPFLAQWGRLTESPQAAAKQPGQETQSEPHTRPAALSPSLSSRLRHAPLLVESRLECRPGPSGWRVAFRGPLLAAWLGQRACFPCDFPGDPSCCARARETSAPRSMKDRVPPELRQQDRTPGGARLWFKLQKGGRKAACGLGHDQRCPARAGASLAGVKALPPVPAQEAARRQRGVTAFGLLGPREPFRVLLPRPPSFRCRHAEVQFVLRLQA